MFLWASPSFFFQDQSPDCRLTVPGPGPSTLELGPPFISVFDPTYSLQPWQFLSYYLFYFSYGCIWSIVLYSIVLSVFFPFVNMLFFFWFSQVACEHAWMGICYWSLVVSVKRNIVLAFIFYEWHFTTIFLAGESKLDLSQSQIVLCISLGNNEIVVVFELSVKAETQKQDRVLIRGQTSPVNIMGPPISLLINHVLFSPPLPYR